MCNAGSPRSCRCCSTAIRSAPTTSPRTGCRSSKRRTRTSCSSASKTAPSRCCSNPEMRVVVVGATGNVGTSLLQALANDDRVEAVLGVARRLPSISIPKVEWTRADITTSDLTTLFRGADAVVHLAWLIQPSRDLEHLRRVNVDGSARLFHAVAD